MEITDSELVALARSGDKEAFGRLIERHQARAVRVARTMVGNEDAAQELAQEALLQAYLSLDRLRDGARFPSWLHGIVRNVCRHHLRDREPDCLSWEALDSEPGIATPAAVDPAWMAEQREEEHLVLEAVHTLSPANREATLLLYYEQRSLQEIAAALNISVGAVKGRLHQSRKQLRERLLSVYPEAIAPVPRDGRRRTMVPVKVVYLPQSRPKEPTADEDAARHYLMQLITATGSWRDWVHLVEEGRDRYLPLPLGREAHMIVALLEETAAEGTATGRLLPGLLKATHTQVEQVRLEPLSPEILHGVVRLRRGGTPVEIAARPGEAIILAVQMEAPVAVVDEIMATASWDLSNPVAVVERIMGAVDETSLRRAAAEPIIGRVAQAFLERGIRHVQEKDGHRTAEVVIETRQQPGWTGVWVVYHYAQGSSSGGNVSLPLDALPVLIGWFKLMANLDLANPQAPQQGHTTVQHQGQAYDLQVSTEPTALGETLRLRVQREPAGDPGVARRVGRGSAGVALIYLAARSS